MLGAVFVSPAPASATAPQAAASDAVRLITARGLRGFIDGAVSVLLGGYLAHLGLRPAAVGTVVAGTLLGSGLLTLVVGLSAHRFSLRRLLIVTGVLMAGTGFCFASFTSFAVLLVVAVIGTLNPSAGDVSVFLPLEQAVLAGAASNSTERTSLFARYNVAGAFAGALGSLGAAVPALAAAWFGASLLHAERAVFVVYAAIGLLLANLYRGLADRPVAHEERRPLARSRARVVRLALLFSLDSFGGGFVVQSMLALWLLRRFDLSLASASTFFFAASLAGALSQFVSPRLAARIGLIPTMVFTHIPANLFLIAAAFMPNLGLTLTFLLLRACLSSMDVPARQAYVMAVVPPEERAAASSVTNVPRSLATALSSAATGFLLEQSGFGWPLILAGGLKIVYDLLLLSQFKAVKPDA
jgi:MFS family permease